MAVTTLAVQRTTQAPATPAASKRRGLRADFAPLSWQWRLITPLALVALWQVLSITGVLPASVLAAPSQIVRTFGSLISDGTLPSALWTSVQRAFWGFLLGAVIAVVLGLLAGLTRVGDAVIDPPLQMIRTVPLLGVVPLFIIWFGIGEIPKILIVALGVAIPLYLNLVSALRSIDPHLYDVADTLRLTPAERLRTILLPGALPGTLVGVRQALGFAWLALIVAEQISAASGLGFMINNARDFLQTDTIVVGLLTYAALGLITDAAVRVAERRALRWRDSTGAAR